MTPDAILADLAAIVRRTFPDREYSGEVTPRTRFFADLGMASIDAVVLAEKVEEHYGRRLPLRPVPRHRWHSMPSVRPCISG